MIGDHGFSYDRLLLDSMACSCQMDDSYHDCLVNRSWSRAMLSYPFLSNNRHMTFTSNLCRAIGVARLPWRFMLSENVDCDCTKGGCRPSVERWHTELLDRLLALDKRQSPRWLVTNEVWWLSIAGVNRATTNCVYVTAGYCFVYSFIHLFSVIFSSTVHGLPPIPH